MFVADDSHVLSKLVAEFDNKIQAMTAGWCSLCGSVSQIGSVHGIVGRAVEVWCVMAEYDLNPLFFGHMGKCSGGGCLTCLDCVVG